MTGSIEELGTGIVYRAVQLMERYGAPDEDSESHDPAERVAKRGEWRGFKIKYRSPDERGNGSGYLRIRLNGELVFYARLEKGWRDHPERISDVRAKAGDWIEKVMLLR